MQVILLFLLFSLLSMIERDLQDFRIEKAYADILFLNAGNVGCHSSACSRTNDRDLLHRARDGHLIPSGSQKVIPDSPDHPGKTPLHVCHRCVIITQGYCWQVFSCYMSPPCSYHMFFSLQAIPRTLHCFFQAVRGIAWTRYRYLYNYFGNLHSLKRSLPFRGRNT